MKSTKRLIVVLFTVVICLLILNLRHGYAQNISVPFSYSVGTATHTACPTVVVGVTQYCYPADGPYVSINGGAWQAIPLSASGVTSVNGKTGAVVLGATTTLQ